MEPYVGLGHFTEAFADRFFGRDTECSLIIGNLRASRLTLLYAESGVGKSSLLRAGVLARLHGFAEHDVELRGKPRLVPVVFSSWSEAPVAGLVRAVAEGVQPYLGADGEGLELPEDDLERALELASTALDTTLLVVLDQFEEYFLYPEGGPEEARVAAQIARCVNRPDLRANFLISIREDSYSRLGDLFRGKVTNVYANFLHLDFLGREGARESIEKPIARINELSAGGERYELEPALVEAVLDQVGRGQIESSEDDGHRGGDRDEIETTYLQLVMRRLWEEETGAGSHRLRLRTLAELGGSQAVITSHLDRAMDAETEGAGLTAEQRLVAASIFHFLVTSGGTKIALTAQDLADLSGRSIAEIEPVLHHLSSPALHILRPVVSENGQGEPRFEIFHDALARPIVEWRTRVEEAELDARLKRERAEKETAQRAAAEAERQAASERRRKRLVLVVLGSAVVALLAIMAYLWIDQENRADQREADTESLRVVQRISELSASPSFPRAKVGLAEEEAYRLSPIDEARNGVLAELQSNPSRAQILTGHAGSVRAVGFWPGSDNLITGGDDKTVRLWDSPEDELAYPLVTPYPVESVAVSESRDGTRVVAAGLQHGIIALWEVDDSGEVRWLKHISLGRKAGAVEGLEFNPRIPGMLAAGSHRGLTLWGLTDPSRPEKLGARQTDFISDLAFGAGGAGLFTAGLEGERWEVGASGFEGLHPKIVDPGYVWSVATAPNGSYAFGTERGVDVWDAAGRPLHHLPSAELVESVAFARGGAVLVSGGRDFNVTTWDVASGRPFGPVRPAEFFITDLAISPNGGTIAASSADYSTRVWTVESSYGLANTVGGLRGQEGFPQIEGLATGANGKFAVAAGRAGTSIWKLPDQGDSGSVPRPLARIRGESYGVAYRGDILAVAHRRSFVLWDTGSGCPSMPARPCRLGAPAKPHSDRMLSSLSLAKYDGHLLLASSGDKNKEGIVNLWDVTATKGTGRVNYLTTLEPGQAPGADPDTTINQIAFSPQNPLLAVATMDGKTRVWDVSDSTDPDGLDFAHARGNEDLPVYAVAFSQDGKLLASGGGDSQVVLWEVAWHPSGATKVTLTSNALFQSQTVRAIAFSPNGETLVAGGDDGRTCVYEVATRFKVGNEECLLGHIPYFSSHGGIAEVRFAHPSSGPPPLLTAGPGQPVVAWDPILWNMSETDRIDQELTERVCLLAGRDLTGEEWNSIFGATKLADKPEETCWENSPYHP